MATGRTLDSTLRPSEALAANREAIRAIASHYPKLTNLRVFGSVLHGTDRPGSDIDFLVDSLDASLFDLCGLEEDLENLLGVRISVMTPGFLHERFRDTVVAEATTV